jgi:hypothetical protein
MKPVGEPYAGNPHVRFDERGWETERCRMAQATAPILDWRVLPKRSVSSYLTFRRKKPSIFLGGAERDMPFRVMMA